VAKNIQAVQDLLNYIDSNFTILRVKNRIATEIRDILINIKWGETVAEVQITLNDSIAT
jgi:hypothetical protein